MRERDFHHQSLSLKSLRRTSAEAKNGNTSEKRDTRGQPAREMLLRSPFCSEANSASQFRSPERLRCHPDWLLLREQIRDVAPSSILFSALSTPIARRLRQHFPKNTRSRRRSEWHFRMLPYLEKKSKKKILDSGDRKSPRDLFFTKRVF